jgi:hypothetical protein
MRSYGTGYADNEMFWIKYYFTSVLMLYIFISIAQSTPSIKDEKRYVAEPRRDSSGNPFL